MAAERWSVKVKDFRLTLLGKEIAPTAFAKDLGVILDAGNHATKNKTSWLVITGSLDKEMLVPEVTQSVIKPN